MLIMRSLSPILGGSMGRNLRNTLIQGKDKNEWGGSRRLVGEKGRGDSEGRHICYTWRRGHFACEEVTSFIVGKVSPHLFKWETYIYPYKVGPKFLALSPHPHQPSNLEYKANSSRNSPSGRIIKLNISVRGGSSE